MSVNWLTWYLLEWRLWMPEAFDYKPFNCRKCLTFWLLLFTAVGSFIAGFHVFGITLAVVAALNAAAMHIDEKNRYGD